MIANLSDAMVVIRELEAREKRLEETLSACDKRIEELEAEVEKLTTECRFRRGVELNFEKLVENLQAKITQLEKVVEAKESDET